MSLVTTKEMFKKAIDECYSIGAFNINNMETVQAIVEAAHEVKSPIILQASSSTIKYTEIEYLVKLVEAATTIYPELPIALHLDHGTDFDICQKCIDAGFTSVMIDGSKYDFEENIRLTKRVVDYAHQRGVVVEAELGILAGIEDEINVDESDALFTNPKEAEEFVKRTGCDSLAISIGNNHGPYKFKGEPKLRFDILKEIKNMIPDFPLVLHGASSVMPNLVELCNQYGGTINDVKGVPEDALRKANELGISKINVDTDLRLAMTAGIRKVFFENPEVIDLRYYLSVSRTLVKETVKDKIVNVFGSANKI